jgi:positive regulator of sigma E activity
MSDDKLFLMAEKSGCGGCPSKLSCGATELTVFYEGKLPGKNKKLKVTGVMTEPEKGRYVFKASRVE